MVDKSNNDHDYSIESEKEAYDNIETLFEDCTDLGASNRIQAHYQFVNELAKSVNDGDIDGDTDDGKASAILSYLGNNSDTLRVVDVKKAFEEKMKELDDSQTLPLNKWLQQNIEYVDIVKSKESNIDTKYEWYVKSGESFDTKRQHNNWSDMMDVLNDVNIMYDFTKPTEDVTGGKKWVVNFMKPLIQNKLNEISEFDGTRTDTIDAIETTIRTRKAFTDIDNAYTGSGIFVEGDYVYILNKIVKNIAEEHGEKPRSIQVEFYKQGITNKKKISQPKYLDNGQKMKFWKLPKEFAEPKEVEEGGDDEDEIVTVTGRGDAL